MPYAPSGRNRNKPASHGNTFILTVMIPAIGPTNLKFLAAVIHELKMDKSI
jgi:hypothetical protein